MTNKIPLHVKSLHEAYRLGTDVKAVLKQCRQTWKNLQDPGIFISACTEEQLDQQLAAIGSFDSDTKPLWGIPYAVKDNIDFQGLPTSAACPAYTYHPEKDAHAVAILRKAGAICLGKTNLDQFATGLTGVRTPYPVPRNAINADLIPGGSSSGSAVAVATGIVSFSLGTDTAGSGRVPAALNNIVGIKPTLGDISGRGVVPACRSLDTVSVFSLSVLDGNLIRTLLTHYDEADPYSRRGKQPGSNMADIKRIAIPDKQSIRFCEDTTQAQSFSETVAYVKKLGIDIVEIDFTPFFKVADLLYEGAWVAERYAAVGNFIDEQPGQIHATTRGIISKAKNYKAVDAFREQYRLQALRRDIDILLTNIDALCVPTVPKYFSLKDVSQDPLLPNSLLGTYTNFVNLLDFCGLTIPTKPREDGLPGSVTLLARAGQDANLAAMAWRLQTALNHTQGNGNFGLAAIAKHSLETSPKNEAFLELAVCGAHMKGLPLNGQLTELGAKYVKSGQTSKDYRLFKLAGGPPFRPGLIHSPGNGDAIKLEVWRIPKHRFAEFIEKVPPPLGIGTVSLDDGEAVKGFICEGYAAAEAQDITHYGGWRKFMASV